MATTFDTEGHTPRGSPLAKAGEPAAMAAAPRGGTTTIAEAVVAKIASQAASEVDHAGGRPRRIVAALTPTSLNRPNADATVDGHIARIKLDVTVEYPNPIRQVTRAVRARVTEQVAALAAMDVTEVDITVVALPRTTSGTRTLE